jgi:predicted nuclease of predicted toxin-antitoxin system
VIGLLLDEGLPRGAAADLRAAGWDVQHVADVGLGAATDHAILSAAERDSRTVVTLDHDFPHLLFLEAAARPSVILLRSDARALQDRWRAAWAAATKRRFPFAVARRRSSCTNLT